MLLSEVAEEVFQQLSLFIREVAEVIEFMNVAQVSKDAVGIGHILVNVVEVADEQLSPAIEFVERLLRACMQAERLVKITYQLDRVSH